MAPLVPVAPSLKGLAQGLPKRMTERPAAMVASEAAGEVSPEVARALPASVNGEEPLSLQTQRTDMFDLFTFAIGTSELFYSANQSVKVTFILETAGPVVISTRAEVVPVLSGKGLSLRTGVPVTWHYPKGSRLYYGCAALNRVGIVIEPIPWMDQVVHEIRGVAKTVGRGAEAIVGALRARLTGGGGPRKMG